VTLKQIAPVDTLVQLTSSQAAIKVPVSVTVLAGTLSATFPVTTLGVDANVIGAVTARYADSKAAANLTVRPVGVSGIKFSPNPVKGGRDCVATITLEAPAGPGGILVTMTTSDPTISQAKTPTFLVPAGSVTYKVALTTKTVTQLTPILVTASAPSRFRAGTMQVIP
jgi:hypothetical protein